MICTASPLPARKGKQARCARLTILLLTTSTWLPQGEALEVRRTSASRADEKASTGTESLADVYYLTRMEDRFMSFAAKHRVAVEEFHNREEKRLEKAIMNATTDKDKALLEATVVSSEESRLEARNAFNEMANFITTLKQQMGAMGSAQSCEDLTCGSHAFCQQSAQTASCRCEEGYEGDGFICKSPMKFMAHSLLAVRSNRATPQVADMHITNLPGNYVAVVFRDISNSHKGFIMLGHADMSRIRWHSPVLFSNQSQAFGPVMVQLTDDIGSDKKKDDYGVAIAFRDQNLGGSGILLGGRINPRTNLVAIGDHRAFARHQAQEMALVPLPSSRVAVFFAEHRLDGDAKKLIGGAMYGTAMLAQVHTDTALPPNVISRQRFVSGPVARITATRLTPTSFAVAYRQGQSGPVPTHAEAACIVGQMRDSELYFNAAPVLLDPERSQIWSRSLALIGDNTFTYTYHSGNERVTKQAVLRADPKTHRLTVQKAPEVIAKGFTPFLSSVSSSTVEDQQAADGKTGLQLVESSNQHSVKSSAKLFTYLSKDGANNAQGQLCAVSSIGNPERCRDLDWKGHDIASVAGAHVDDGRAVFVFTDSKGQPFYQFVGL